MAQEAPPTPQQEHYQQPSPGRHRSRPDANLVTKTALISAVVICVAALLVPWRLPAASPAKRAAAARSSASARDIAAGLCIAADPGSAADPGDASISEAETEADAAPAGSDADAGRRARRLDAQVRR